MKKMKEEKLHDGRFLATNISGHRVNPNIPSHSIIVLDPVSFVEAVKVLLVHVLLFLRPSRPSRRRHLRAPGRVAVVLPGGGH